MKLNRKYTRCQKCNTDISISNYNRHSKKCQGEKSYWSKKWRGEIKVDNNVNCKFCNKICKNSNSQRNHSRLCKLNPNRQFSYLTTNREEARKNIQYSNQYVKAKALGLPLPKLSEESRQKISNAGKNRSQETRDRIARAVSNTVKRKVQEGTWHTSLAKKMHYTYKGVDLHGKWELRYAQWMDKNNIKWERCKQIFNYIFNGEQRRYTPDFYLIESNVYIEIKGYKTAKDEAKWSQFPKERKLKILMKEDLQQLGINIE